MQTAVENTGSLTRQLTVTVPHEEVQNVVDQRLKKIAKTAKIKGFRPGKAPINVIKSNYGAQAQQEAFEEVINRTLQEALTQQKITPVTRPEIQDLKAEKDQPMIFVATFEIFPEIPLTDLSKLVIEKRVIEISEHDIDTMLERMRKQHATWQEVSRVSQKGDRVSVDYTATINGEAFEGNEGKNIHIILGEKRFLPEFETALIGVTREETKKFPVTFPENYAHKAVAGKTAQFTITVLKVEEPILPEINEEFARKMGVADGSLNTLREQVKNLMQFQIKDITENDLKSKLFEQLEKVHANIELPQSLVQQEIETLHHNMHAHDSTHQHSDHHHDHSAADHPELADAAKKRVHRGLLLKEYAKHFDLKLDPKRVLARLENLSKSYEDPNKILNWYLSDQRRLAEIQTQALEEQFVERMLTQVKVDEKAATYAEVMGLSDWGK